MKEKPPRLLVLKRHIGEQANATAMRQLDKCKLLTLALPHFQYLKLVVFLTK